MERGGAGGKKNKILCLQCFKTSVSQTKKVHFFFNIKNWSNGDKNKT